MTGTESPGPKLFQPDRAPRRANGGPRPPIPAALRTLPAAGTRGFDHQGPWYSVQALWAPEKVLFWVS